MFVKENIFHQRKSYTADKQKKYMYKLLWEWSDERKCIFIMLNPARFYELRKNKTVKNCKTIAEDLKCGGMVLIDLFPYAAKGPRLLMKAKENGKDIIGSQNKHEECLRSAIENENALIIFAWGDTDDNRRSPEFKKAVDFDTRVKDIKALIKKYAVNNEIKCLKDKTRLNDSISHPYWLANANLINGETDEEHEARIKKEVLANYKLEDFIL